MCLSSNWVFLTIFVICSLELEAFEIYFFMCLFSNWVFLTRFVSCCLELESFENLFFMCLSFNWVFLTKFVICSLELESFEIYFFIGIIFQLQEWMQLRAVSECRNYKRSQMEPLWTFVKSNRTHLLTVVLRPKKGKQNNSCQYVLI